MFFLSILYFFFYFSPHSWKFVLYYYGILRGILFYVLFEDTVYDEKIGKQHARSPKCASMFFQGYNETASAMFGVGELYPFFYLKG